MRINRVIALAGASLLAVPVLTPAQHYVPGVEGIKAASLPPPGVYLRDYNLAYWADQINDNRGNKIGAVDPKTFVYANVPRLIWITDLNVLGGNVGMDALLPLVYTHLDVSINGAKQIDNGTFGLGDFFFEGTWSKHIEKFDVALGYGIYTPTGDSSTDQFSTRAGLGFVTHMFTAGATYYFDPEKRWALSALNRYEINQRKNDMDYTAGQTYTVEGGLSYGVTKTTDVGVVGYYQQMVTKSSGSEATGERPNVAAIGPEINTFFPKHTLELSLRYLCEFTAENRPQGQTLTFTVTKRF